MLAYYRTGEDYFFPFSRFSLASRCLRDREMADITAFAMSMVNHGQMKPNFRPGNSAPFQDIFFNIESESTFAERTLSSPVNDRRRLPAR